jgi:hypothetical protein
MRDVVAVIAKASAQYSSCGWPLAPPLLKLSETARGILDPKASRSASANSSVSKRSRELALSHASRFSPNAFYLRIH